MSSSLLGDLTPLYPVVEKDLSDSGSIDCSIEFLMQAGGRLVDAVARRTILRRKSYPSSKVTTRSSYDCGAGSLAK